MEITYCDRDDICVNRQKVLSIIGIEEHYLSNLIEFRKLWLPIINSKLLNILDSKRAALWNTTHCL